LAATESSKSSERILAFGSQYRGELRHQYELARISLAFGWERAKHYGNRDI